ncbi:MAG: sulfatase-like hydrolase/transferase [Verrucomicrobiota bacterium]
MIVLAADGWSEADVGTPGAWPHLEKLAASGARWTRAYAGAASTPASRAALLTGRHSGHGRLRGATPAPLANEDVTLGEVFRAAGYRTAAIGVWDLGGNNTQGHPLRQGFSDWFGFLDSKEALDLYPKALWRNAEIFDNLIDSRGRLANYAPEWFARFATNYVQVHEDHPFFLYLAHPLPGITASGEVRARHLQLWDRLVGAVVRELEQSRIVRDTILVVTSTGGAGPGEDRLSEGRLRVPFWVSWPGKIPAGQTHDRPVALWDVLPTVAALARVRGPAELDGISLAPELLGGQEPLPRAGGLYWETAEAAPRRAILWDHWKAVERQSAGEVELFDLQADPGALKNLAESQPERLSEARRRLRESADPLPSSRP